MAIRSTASLSENKITIIVVVVVVVVLVAVVTKWNGPFRTCHANVLIGTRNGRFGNQLSQLAQ